ANWGDGVGGAGRWGACAGGGGARALARGCTADRGPPQTGTVPGLQRIIPLRSMLRCARDTVEGGESARIELDHEVRLHLHGVGHVGELRDADEFGRHFRVVDLDIVRHVALGQRDRLQHDRELLRLLLDLDEIADFDAIARDRDAPTVHLDVAMADELPRGEHRRHQLCPIDHGIEPTLEQPDHMGAGIALHADGFVVDAVELALADIAVIAPPFLLGAQLHAVVGELAFAALAVLAGTIFAAVDGTLWAAPHILPHTAVDLVFRLVALGHRVLMGCWLEDRALLCPGFAGTDRSWPKRRARPRGRETPRSPPRSRGAGFLGAKQGQVKPLLELRSFPRKRESRGQRLGPRFRGDEQKRAPEHYQVTETLAFPIRSPGRRRFRSNREGASARSADRPACAG